MVDVVVFPSTRRREVFPDCVLTRIDARSASIAAASCRLTDTPVSIDARSVCPLTLKHS
jgi:hypothetical protein